MRCHDVEAGLEDYVEGTLGSSVMATVEAHLNGCPRCRQSVERRQAQEEALRDLFAPVAAPPDLLPHIRRGLDQRTTAPSGLRSLLRRVRVEASPRGITRIRIGPGQSAIHRAAKGVAARALREIREYLEGGRTFFDLPWDREGIDPFQRRVLEAAGRIPFGEVRSYGWLAETMGAPRAARAVGNALGRNPVPLLIPCHRIVKSDGSIGGYAFGRSLKADLLALERTTSPYVGCSTTRILCRRGCSQERRVAEGNRIHFASIKDALSSGYRPCKVCSGEREGERESARML